MTNGPYRLVDRVPGGGITLEVNPHHPEAGAIAIRRVAFLPMSDMASAVRRFAAGSSTRCPICRSTRSPTCAAASGPRSFLGPSLGLEVLVVNTHKAPFSDRRVRRALSLLIDREYLPTGSTAAP